MEEVSGSSQHAAGSGSLSEKENGSIDVMEIEAPQVEKEKWKWKGEILFFTLFCSNVFVFMSFALMGPLFPEKAKSKGVTYTIQGWIFGIYALTQIISSPLIGMVMPYTGYRSTFITGILLASTCNITFGFLPWIEDRSFFIISCFACRVGGALGVSAMNNAMFVIAALTWPDDIAFRLGTLETSSGIGIMIGPGCAGLAELAGYYLPFLVLGILPILPAAMATIIMQKGETSQSTQTVSILELLKIPGVFLMSLAMIEISATALMIQPTLAYHLNSYGLSLSLMGYVFLIQPVCFTVLTPIVGKIAGWAENKLAFMVFGICGMGVSFLFLGPSALLGLKHYKHLWPILVSLGAIGFFWAFSVIPIYDRFTSYATYARPDIDIEILMGVVGSLLYMMMSTGDFLGPILAGSLLDAYGFEWTMTVAGLVSLCMGTMLIVTLLMFGNGAITFERCCVRNTGHLSENTCLVSGKVSPGIINLKEVQRPLTPVLRPQNEF